MRKQHGTVFGLPTVQSHAKHFSICCAGPEAVMF